MSRMRSQKEQMELSHESVVLLECVSSVSYKFYEIEVSKFVGHSSLTMSVIYGRKGECRPRRSYKGSFHNEISFLNELEKLIAQKISRGYFFKDRFGDQLKLFQ